MFAFGAALLELAATGVLATVEPSNASAALTASADLMGGTTYSSSGKTAIAVAWEWLSLASALAGAGTVIAS